MSEQYTPTTVDVEAAFIVSKSYSGPTPTILPAEARGMWARWLAQVRREAKIEALRGFANALDLEGIADEWSTNHSEHWAAGNAASAIQIAAHDRADRLEQEGKNDE